MDPLKDGYCLKPDGTPVFFVPLPGVIGTLRAEPEPEKRKKKQSVERKAIRPDEDK